jgi:capsular exopolysaccharide synthesis family protein
MKVVAVSSSISGEGKSFLAQNLSGVIALSKKKVVLLDLDMRKPKKLLPFEVPDLNKGVSTILIKKDNWKDCIISTHIPSLDYLPNGPIPPNPAELLINGEFEQLLFELKEHYDFVVLDTPPAGLVTDGVMAMKKADISIYMFRCNYSRKENLRTLDRMIQINKINNIAVVFNDFIPPSDNGYGYYEESKPTRKFLKFFKS